MDYSSQVMPNIHTSLGFAIIWQHASRSTIFSNFVNVMKRYLSKKSFENHYFFFFTKIMQIYTYCRVCKHDLVIKSPIVDVWREIIEEWVFQDVSTWMSLTYWAIFARSIHWRQIGNLYSSLQKEHWRLFWFEDQDKLLTPHNFPKMFQSNNNGSTISRVYAVSFQ